MAEIACEHFEGIGRVCMNEEGGIINRGQSGIKMWTRLERIERFTDI